jgi:hypothetical protein
MKFSFDQIAFQLSFLNTECSRAKHDQEKQNRYNKIHEYKFMIENCLANLKNILTQVKIQERKEF